MDGDADILPSDCDAGDISFLILTLRHLLCIVERNRILIQNADHNGGYNYDLLTTTLGAYFRR